MEALVTAGEMRLLEADAVERGATWEGLMETAGSRIATALRRHVGPLGPASDMRVLVVCGPGNNGGDGLVVARHLAEQGWLIRCLTWMRDANDERLQKPLLARHVPVIPLSREGVATGLQDSLSWCTLVVDALFGTGLKRDIGGDLAPVFEALASSGKPVIAVDIPSGIDSDTGAVRGMAIPASLTITVGLCKYGHFLHPGKDYRGELQLEEIGLDANKSREIAKGTLLSENYVRGLLPQRPADSNKGTFGKAFVVAGSINFIGAAALATEGAMRSGAGLVTLGCPGDLLLMLASKLTECTYLPLPSDLGAIASQAAEKLLPELESYKSLLIGCGLGRDKDTAAFVKNMLVRQEAHTHTSHYSTRPIGFAALARKEEDKRDETHNLPRLVLDGDALNIMSEWHEWWNSVPEGSILTPHPGEMARLTGGTVDEVQKDRVGIATSSAAKWKQVVVLKGAATVIASPDGKVFVSPFSNPALATAGTGDVLAGTIVGLLAQGLEPVDAACAGVYLHGLAGEMLRAEYGVSGGLAGDLPVLIARAQRKVREGDDRSSTK